MSRTRLRWNWPEVGFTAAVCALSVGALVYAWSATDDRPNVGTPTPAPMVTVTVTERVEVPAP